MRTRLEPSGSYPRPGWIGRSVRVASGILILHLTLRGVIYDHGDVVRFGWGAPILAWVPGFLLSVHLLPAILDRGFGLRWGRRSQAVLAVVFLGGLSANVILFDTIWAPPVGVLVVLTVAFVLGYLGVSFLVAGFFATPG